MIVIFLISDLKSIANQHFTVAIAVVNATAFMLCEVVAVEPVFGFGQINYVLMRSMSFGVLLIA